MQSLKGAICKRNNFFIKVPESPSQVSITSIMETSLEVTWTPADPLDLVLQYMVEVKNMSGAWKPITEIIQGTSVVVNNLRSFTTYTFRVRAENGLGTSNYSQSSRNVTTLEGGMVKSLACGEWGLPSPFSARLRHLLFASCANNHASYAGYKRI